MENETVASRLGNQITVQNGLKKERPWLNHGLYRIAMRKQVNHTNALQRNTGHVNHTGSAHEKGVKSAGFSKHLYQRVAAAHIHPEPGAEHGGLPGVVRQIALLVA